MIKLDDRVLRLSSTQYFTYIIQKIELAYNTEKTNFSNDINLFTQNPVVEMFEKNNILDIQCLEDLLIEPFEVTFRKYPELKDYMLTSMLVFYSKELSVELKAGNSLKERQQIRKDFVEEYNNSWINPLIQNSDYFKSSIKFNMFIKCVKDRLETINNITNKFINYDFLESNKRHDFLVKLDNSVCPYCNRQYITNYDDGGEMEKSTADLDHFYPKSYFPLFSLSLYNFVPSCQICNSRFKLAVGKNILYPYENGFEKDVKFEIKLNSASDINSLLGYNTNFILDFKVDKMSKNEKKINNSIELFRLKQIYQHHIEYVRELLYKKQAYSNTYKKQLEDLFSDMNFDVFEINLFLYGNELKIDELGKKPLSKLAYDILN